MNNEFVAQYRSLVLSLREAGSAAASRCYYGAPFRTLVIDESVPYLLRPALISVYNDSVYDAFASNALTDADAGDEHRGRTNG